MYVGGYFSFVGVVTPANSIARYDASNQTWSALGLGTNYIVDCLLFDYLRGILYVGGRFSQAGGITVNYIAQFDTTTSTWSALGSGIGGPTPSVWALAFDAGGNILYVGGSFTTAGGITTNSIAQWNAGFSTWAALGTGVTAGSKIVYSLALDSSISVLYIGGQFTSVSGVSCNNIAQWNAGPSTWVALGGGITSGIPSVSALLFDSVNHILYVGGQFGNAGPSSVGNISLWIPVSSTWGTLGFGVGGKVSSFALDSTNNRLYVGGYFLTAGGVSANYMAEWNTATSTWSSLGTGLNFPSWALGFDGLNSRLYVAGQFALRMSFCDFSFETYCFFVLFL
jgi:hypothetical protein